MGWSRFAFNFHFNFKDDLCDNVDVQVDEQLYRVKSCPDIEEVLLLEQVKLRARNPDHNQQQQRYSCGASLDNQAMMSELSTSTSSNNVIQVS